jgi:GntR family transcriptional repressor for pyruvate dehydrogenase complex
MSTWLREQRHVALLEPYEDKQAYAAHSRIFEAVAARDPDAAEAAMRQHLEWGWISYWKRYGSAETSEK